MKKLSSHCPVLSLPSHLFKMFIPAHVFCLLLFLLFHGHNNLLGGRQSHSTMMNHGKELRVQVWEKCFAHRKHSINAGFILFQSAEGHFLTISSLKSQPKITLSALKFYFYPGLFSSENISLTTCHCIRFLLLLAPLWNIVGPMGARTLSILFADTSPLLKECHSRCSVCWISVEWMLNE